jgi:hypothetical protein
MLKMPLEIDGRPVRPDQIKNALEAAIFHQVEERTRSKLAGIRDSETGEFPIIAVRGRDLEHLSITVSGSESLIALVKERLGTEASLEGDQTMNQKAATNPPIAFLAHASEDKDLARKIAHSFHAHGIKTFFDEWEIAPGDSIRQKIDAGLGECSHFIVLLTPNSIRKPWVNAEIDAAFVRKVDGQCRFIPLRSEIEPHELPPLLRALHSPQLKDHDGDISGLIDAIYGVSKRPPVGPAPRLIREGSSGKLGLSPAAEAIVKLMVERSEHGNKFDPQIEADELREATGLHDEDIIEAVDELESRRFVGRHSAIGNGPLGFLALYPEGALFAEFDKFFKDWNPEIDAVSVAADLVNGQGVVMVSAMAEANGWPPRRINPAVHYLIKRGLVDVSRSLGIHPWCSLDIRTNARTRRFVRDRS